MKRASTLPLEPRHFLFYRVYFLYNYRHKGKRESLPLGRRAAAFSSSMFVLYVRAEHEPGNEKPRGEGRREKKGHSCKGCWSICTR